MLTNTDRHIATKKRRMFNRISTFGYPANGIGFFNNHRSFSCGNPSCSFCKAQKYDRRIRLKRSRAKARLELKNY